jgi:hypothetical protein
MGYVKYTHWMISKLAKMEDLENQKFIITFMGVMVFVIGLPIVGYSNLIKLFMKVIIGHSNLLQI